MGQRQGSTRHLRALPSNEVHRLRGCTHPSGSIYQKRYFSDLARTQRERPIPSRPGVGSRTKGAGEHGVGCDRATTEHRRRLPDVTFTASENSRNAWIPTSRVAAVRSPSPSGAARARAPASRSDVPAPPGLPRASLQGPFCQFLEPYLHRRVQLVLSAVLGSLECGYLAAPSANRLARHASGVRSLGECAPRDEGFDSEPLLRR